jgi:hypothetical protein
MPNLLTSVSLLACAIATLAISPAEARHRHRHYSVHHGIHRFAADQAAQDANGNRAFRDLDIGTVIGSRPSDCPHAYCGCGLRKHLGLLDVRLNLASNWLKYFPREPSPRVGLAAVRRHHVMYIEASAGEGLWTVRDYNSGGGLSRIHVRDVQGYAFVNPHRFLASR